MVYVHLPLIGGCSGTRLQLYRRERTITITCHFPRSTSHMLIQTNFNAVRICTGWWLIICTTNLASATNNFVNAPWVFASYCLSVTDPTDPECSRMFSNVRDQGVGNRDTYNMLVSAKHSKTSAEPPRLLEVAQFQVAVSLWKEYYVTYILNQSKNLLEWYLTTMVDIVVKHALKFEGSSVFVFKQERGLSSDISLFLKQGNLTMVLWYNEQS